MIFFNASFCLFFGSLLFQEVSSATNTSNAVVSNKTPDVSASTICHNVHFNNYYSGPANKDIKAHLIRIENRLTDIQKKLDTMIGNKTTKAVTKDCAELYKTGERISGVYTIDPDDSGAFDVFCDQTTAGGGWTVFQRRVDGSVDFNRGWADYKSGFGNPSGEFWLGLDKINRLTKTRSRLRVELEDTQGKTANAEYDFFAVSSERDKYKLSLGTYSGTAGDSLSYHRNSAFSTKDRDNDQSSGNCAVSYKGGWWFNSCVIANLNGYYYHGPHSSDHDGVNWRTWKGRKYSAKRAEMKTRPADF
ncbi:hypothetical protein ACROYT_G037682 [Oculina patagonica]